jgi:hypothetical protein
MREHFTEEDAMKRAIAAFALLLSLALVARAQDPGPDSEHGRFTFKQVSDGLLRLDTSSGAVALCSKRAVGWACQTVPEDRVALESEIARLQDENTALKREFIAHGLSLPNGIKTPPGSPKSGDQDLRMPSDADLDRAMSFLEKAWRRLVEMVQRLQREMESDKDKKQLQKGEIDKKS